MAAKRKKSKGSRRKPKTRTRRSTAPRGRGTSGDAENPDRVPTLKALAPRLNRSYRQVKRYRAEGLPQEPDGCYDVRKAIAWLTRREAKTPSPAEAPGSPAAQKSGQGEPSTPEFLDWEEEVKKWRAKALELKYRVDSGELVPADKVIRIWERHITDVKTILEGLPDRILLHLPPEVRNAVRSQVQREIERTLLTLAGDEE